MEDQNKAMEDSDLSFTYEEEKSLLPDDLLEGTPSEPTVKALEPDAEGTDGDEGDHASYGDYVEAYSTEEEQESEDDGSSCPICKTDGNHERETANPEQGSGKEDSQGEVLGEIVEVWENMLDENEDKKVDSLTQGVNGIFIVNVDVQDNDGNSGDMPSHAIRMDMGGEHQPNGQTEQQPTQSENESSTPRQQNTTNTQTQQNASPHIPCQGAQGGLPPNVFHAAPMIDPGLSEFPGVSATEFESYLKYFEEYARLYLGPQGSQWGLTLMQKVNKRVRNAIKENIVWDTPYQETLGMIRRAIYFMSGDEESGRDDIRDPLVAFFNIVRHEAEGIDAYGVRLAERFVRAFPGVSADDNEWLRNKLLDALNKRDASEFKISLASSGPISYKRMVKLAGMIENKNKGQVRFSDRTGAMNRHSVKVEEVEDNYQREMMARMDSMHAELQQLKIDRESQAAKQGRAPISTSARNNRPRSTSPGRRRPGPRCNYCQGRNHKEQVCYLRLKDEGLPVKECDFCHFLGHTQEECRKKAAEEKNKEKSTGEGDVD